MKARLVLILGVLFLHSAFAQGTAFTYQGRVTDNGTNFTGVGQFKFALVTPTNLNHTATAWINNMVGMLYNLSVASVTLLDGGNGYVTPPAVTIRISDNDPANSAEATAIISGGSVTGFNLISGGDGYYLPPAVTIAPPPPDYANFTLWSNDGTANGQPMSAVNVGVTNGLFTVVLGDTNLPGMTAIPAAVFAQYAFPNLAVQIWFNDGVNGFVALNPPQNLTPAPQAAYASMAGAASNLLGTLPTSQLTGTYSGNGSGLTSLPAASLTGSVPAAALTAVPAASLTGTIPPAALGTTNSYAPTIGDGTHNFTTTTQSGYYAKVGNLVYFEVWLQWSSKGSATASANLQISLPPVAVVSPRADFTIGFLNGFTFTNELKAGAGAGASALSFYNISSTGGTSVVLPVSGCGTSGEIQVSGFYRWQ